MATLYVTEFARQGRDLAGYLNQNGCPEQPPVAEQTVAIGASSAASAAFNANTSIVRLHADAICSVEFGAAPTAATTTMRMVAGQTEYFTVVPGSALKVAAITNT